MRLRQFSNTKTLSLLAVLLFFVLGSFSISLAHDPTTAIAPLVFLQLSQPAAIAHSQPEHHVLAVALVAEVNGAPKPLNAASARVEHCFIKRHGPTANRDIASLRTPKVSLQIIKSALQI